MIGLGLGGLSRSMRCAAAGFAIPTRVVPGLGSDVVCAGLGVV